MSSSNYYKAPPRKTDDLTYENWKKEVSIWQFQTNVETNKQGGALFLSLEGKPRQTVLAEVTVADINSEQGVSNIFKAVGGVQGLKNKLGLYEREFFTDSCGF